MVLNMSMIFMFTYNLYGKCEKYLMTNEQSIGNDDNPDDDYCIFMMTLEMIMEIANDDSSNDHGNWE